MDIKDATPMDDQADADALIAGAPDINMAEAQKAMDAHAERQAAAEEPETQEATRKKTNRDPVEVDTVLADMGARAIQDALAGFGLESSETINELGGTLISDVAALVPNGTGRVGRIAVITGLIGLVITPPLLRFFGVIGPVKTAGQGDAA